MYIAHNLITETSTSQLPIFTIQTGLSLAYQGGGLSSGRGTPNAALLTYFPTNVLMVVAVVLDYTVRCTSGTVIWAWTNTHSCIILILCWVSSSISMTVSSHKWMKLIPSGWCVFPFRNIWFLVWSFVSYKMKNTLCFISRLSDSWPNCFCTKYF